MIRTRTVAAIFVVASMLSLGSAAETASATTIPHYKNCTAMHAQHKHGVGKSGAKDHVSGHTKPVTNFYVSTSIYNANKSLDRDHDGVACEAH